MSRPVRLSIFAVVLALAGVATSAASTPVNAPRPWDEDDGPLPSSMLTTVKCRIDEVAAGRRLLLFDHATKKHHRIAITQGVELRARSKKEFGRKKLKFDDLAVGQEVKVTFERKGEVNEIVRIQVVKTAPVVAATGAS